MEFLQRHLPRVYQAVQDALNFFTNVTAQVFGAPPNAPQPRDARTNVPIQTPKESAGGPPAEKEECGRKETNLLTSIPELSSAKEENGDSAKVLPGDEDYRTRETDLRHRKSDPGGRRDLEYRTTEDVDIILHTTAEVTTYSYGIEVRESTDLENIVTISHDAQSILNQEQVNPPGQLDLKKENRELSISCEIKVSQYEEAELIPRTVHLASNEPLQNSEHKVYKDGQHFRGQPSSADQREESVFQPTTLKSLSFEDEYQLGGITGQERPEEELKMKYLIELTTESEDYTINTEQGTQVLVESIESTVIMECDADNILDVNETHKKLVTPVGETEVSSYSQGGDSRKTLEDLLETANRLAKHCDSVQNVEDQKGSDNVQDLDETPGSIPESILSKEQGFAEEVLTYVDDILAKSTFLAQQREHKEANLEEETMKEESLVLEQSEFSGESNSNSAEEGEDMSTVDVKVEQSKSSGETNSNSAEEGEDMSTGGTTNREDVQGIEEKVEEKHKSKESESQPKTSKKQRNKRRVHFSPSTEDLFKKSERSSRSTFQMVCDDILEGEMQPNRDDPEQLASSYIIEDLSLSLNKEDEGDYLGVTTCSHDDGQSTSEEEQTKVIDEDRSLWYDDYPAQEEQRCESLGDVTNQHVHVTFKMEESFVAVTERRSEEHFEHIPSSEETSLVEAECAGSIDTSESEKVKFEQIELFTENKNESHAFQEKDSSTASDGAEETVSKEDSFLQEAMGQVDYPLEERTDLPEYDTTHVKEFVDDSSQSLDTLETKEDGLPKDFTDEQKQTDNQAIPCHNYQPEDSDNKQLDIISQYSSYKHITETGSTADYNTEKQFISDQLRLLETDKNLESEYIRTEVQEVIFSSVVKDVLKSSQEQAGPSILQSEDTLLRQPVSRNSTSTDEMCISVLEDVVLGDGLISEEHKEVLGENEPLDETFTPEMEEHQEHINDKPNYDFKHEGFPPETSESQEEDSKVEIDHIKVELLTEQQCVAEEKYVAVDEGLGNEQMQDDKLIRQLVPADGNEECPEESYETDQRASLNEVRTSIVQDVLIREGLVSEECSEILKDADFKAQSESCNKTITCEVHEHTAVKQDDDYIQEDFQLDTRESQEEDIKVTINHTEVEFMNKEQFVAEEQLVVHDEDSTKGVSCNDQLQEDQEQPIFRDGDEVGHKELFETEQTISEVEVCTSIVEDILKREDQVSEEFNDIFKDVDFRAESESLNETMTHKVLEHTAINQNDDYTHEHFQTDATELQEEDIKVKISHAEVEFVIEEQFVPIDEAFPEEEYRNDQPREDGLLRQAVSGESDEPCLDKSHETELSKLPAEICTSIAEEVQKEDSLISEKDRDVFGEVSLKTESKPHSETSTCELQQHTDVKQNDYISEDILIKSIKSQGLDSEVNIGHLEVVHLTEEQLIADDQFRVDDEMYAIEASNGGLSIEDILPAQPVSRDSDEGSPEKLHEIELSASLNEICTSIVADVLLRDVLVSEDSREVSTEAGFKEEIISHSEPSTCEVEELQDHTAEEQNNDYITEVSLTEINKSQEDESEVKTDHLQVENVKEGQSAAEEQFEVSNEASPIKRASITDQFEEDGSIGQPDSTDSDELLHEKLLEAEQNESAVEICTSIVEKVLITEGLVSEECSDVIKDADFKTESESRSETTTYEVQEHRAAKQKHEDSQLDAKESQEVSKVKIGHIEVEFLKEEQFVAEQKLVVDDEGSTTEGSCNDQQEDKSHEHPVSRDGDAASHQVLYETEESPSMVGLHTAVVEEVLIREDLVSEEFCGVFNDVNFTLESESHNETSTGGVQEHIDYHPDSQLKDSMESKFKIGHIEDKMLLEEQFAVTDEAGPAEGSSQDQLQEGRLPAQPISRDSEETELSASVIEVCPSIAENVLIREDLGSEDHIEVFTEEGLQGASKSHMGTTICEVEELQEYTAEEQNADFIYDVSLTETSKPQEDDSEVNTIYLEAENITEEQLVAEEQFEVPIEASPVVESNIDQLQEDSLLQTVSKESDELSNEELYGAERSASVVEICTSIVDDVLISESLVSEELSGIIKDTHFKAESEFRNETTTSDVQEHSAEKLNNDYRHEEFQPETSKSQEEDSRFELGQAEVVLLTEEQFVVTDEASPAEGSNQDQLQEGRLPAQPISRDSDETELSASVNEVCPSIAENVLIREGLGSEDHIEIFPEADLQGERKSHMGTSTCEVEELQEYTAEEKNADVIYDVSLTETSKPQGDDSEVNIGYLEAENITEGQLVAEEQFEVPIEASPVVESNIDQLQEDSLLQTVSKDSDELSNEELYGAERSASVVKICTSIVDDVLISESLVSEELSGIIKDTHFKAESESHNETTTSDVQEHSAEKLNNDYRHEEFQPETNKLQEEDSRFEVGQAELVILTEEQFVVTDEVSPAEGSNQDQLQEGRLPAQPISRDSDETGLSASVNEVCPSIAENVLIREDLGSEDHIEVFPEEGLQGASKSHMGTSTCEVEELQEYTAEETNADVIYDVSLTETSKPQGDDTKVNTCYLEAENITEEQLVAEEQFEVPNEASPVVESNIDQLQEDSLLQTVSKESDELSNEELYGTERSASVVEICTSIVDDVLISESLVSGELSGIIKDTHFEAESETHHEPTTSDVQEHSAEKLNNDYRHEEFRPETNKSQEEDSRFEVGQTEVGILTEDHFVVTDESCQVEGSSNDQFQEDRLQKEHTDEEQVVGYKDYLTETSKAQGDDSVLNTGHIKVENVTKEHFVDEEKFEVYNDSSRKERASTSDQLQEVVLLGQLDFSDIDNISPEKLHETEQSTSVTEICTSIVEDVLIRDNLLSEEHREVFGEVSLKTESESDSKTSTCEVEELQEHIEVDILPKEQCVVEEQLVVKHELSLTDEGGDHAEEKHDSSDDTNETFIRDSEEYKHEDHLKLLQESYGQEDYYHQATDAVAQYAILESTMDQDKTRQSHEELNLLSEINSLISSSLLDQSISVSPEDPDAGLDIQNVHNVMASIAKESGSEMESELYASHITTSTLDNNVEVTEIADSEVEKVSKSHEELDLLSEIHCSLSPDHTVCGIPEIMDDLDSNGKVTIPLEDQSDFYAEEQAPERTKDLDVLSELHLEGHLDVKDNWKSSSDSNFETSKDFMLEIQSVVTEDHTDKNANFSSSVKLEESEVRVEKEVDERTEETESHLTSGHSVNKTEDYFILQTSMVNKQVDNEQEVTSTEKPEITHEPGQVQGQVNRQDSPSQTLVISTGVLEEVVHLGVINTSAEMEISFTSELHGPEMDVKSLTEAGHIQEEVDIISEAQPSTNEETTTICLHEVEHTKAEHEEKEEDLPIIQTTCHEDITRGQEQTLVDGIGMSIQRAVQEEDDFFSKVPFHSTLDVSAQKSRILLLRKTSVRRRPGQRPVTFQEDLPDPSPPANLPLNMGVPVFPEKMSTLSPAVPPDPESSYPAEETTEASVVAEPILRRKSSVRRRQRPGTFLEDLAEPSLPGITPAESSQPTQEPTDDGSMSEQLLRRKSSIRRPQGQRPVALEDEPVEPAPPVIAPLKMGVPNFLGGMPILLPAVAPAPESLHPAKEPKDEGTTSETMLRRKSSMRRPKGKQPVTSEEQTVETPPSVIAPLRMGVPLFSGVPAHVTPAPVSSIPAEEPREEKKASEELAIKPKKGFLKHAGFGGAHPGMMQELQARLHKKKPKE